MFRILIAIACLCLGAGAAWATILNVPGDYATIQAAVDAAVIGDEIVIAAGSYESFASLVHGGFTIRGEGEVLLVPDPEGYSMGFYCAFEYDVLPVIFEHLVFTGFYQAISYEMECPMELRDCTFRQCDSAIFGCGEGPLVLRDCLFEDNHAEWAGGAISSCGAVLDIADCVFLNNTAAVKGGAIYSDTPFGSRRYARCLFVGNDAPQGCAVQVEYGGPVDFEQCTFHANGRSGAAVINVEMANSTLNLSRCIVTGSPGSAFSCTDAGVLNIDCTDAWGNAEGDWTDCAAGQLGLNGNISADPLFCDAAGGDFTIDGSSPCAPSQSGCGLLIGALPPGCGLTSVPEQPAGTAQESSLSAIKSKY